MNNNCSVLNNPPPYGPRLLHPDLLDPFLSNRNKFVFLCSCDECATSLEFYCSVNREKIRNLLDQEAVNGADTMHCLLDIARCLGAESTYLWDPHYNRPMYPVLIFCEHEKCVKC